ncbi:Conserved_hypothetical protein [Hexamita inflata]|uniref:Uncharacterized protein n=1 Tax=Hexamita inflata TaxID=28002 RepID=A0AA86TZ60_9EUKA|nr:Conserved hypothetical protein [Hexamita inflata]
MSDLVGFIQKLIELTKDKQKKVILQRLSDDIKKLPETSNPADKFKDNHELLMNIFMTGSEYVKGSSTSHLVGSMKLIKLLLIYLEASPSDQMTVSLTLKYILQDMPATKEEVSEELTYLIVSLTDCPELFAPPLQKLAFIRLYELTLQKGIKIEHKAIVELAIQKLYLFTFNTESSTNTIITTYFNFSLTSDDTAIDLQGVTIQKMNPLIILNTVLTIGRQIKDQDKIMSLYRTIMKRKFQQQKFNDENNKFFGSSSLPEGFRIKDFCQSQVVYLYALAQQVKIKQPMLNQVLFAMMQLQICLSEHVTEEIKYDFLLTLFDQIKNIAEEDQFYQYTIILGMTNCLVKHLFQIDKLSNEIILTVLKHVSNYFMVLKQLQQQHYRFVANPGTFVSEIFEHNNTDLNFFTASYVANPSQLQYYKFKDQQALITMFSLDIMMVLMKAYQDKKLPKLEIENLNLFFNLCKYFINEFGKIDTSINLTACCVSTMCAMLRQLESESMDKYLYGEILSFILQTPKIMIQKDQNQPWTAPFKIQNKASMSKIYTIIVSELFNLKQIALDDFIDLHYTGMSLILSMYMQPNTNLGFSEFQQYIIKGKDNDRELVDAFSSFYNIKIDEEDQFDRKYVICQHEQYLDSLCQIILNEVTPKKYVELFSQILVNEFVFIKENEIQPILDLAMSELFGKVVFKQLEQKQLKQKARKLLTELIKYQLIAKHKDAELTDHYKPMQNYLQTINSDKFVEFNFFNPVKSMFKSDDLGFVVDLVIQIVQFTIDHNLQLTNIEQVEQFLTEYLDENKFNCQQSFVQLINLLAGSEKVQELTLQTQQHLLEMLFDIINNFYEGRMQCPMDEAYFVHAASDFFKSTNFVQIFYEVAEYLYMQCINSVAGSKLVVSYLGFIQQVLVCSHGSYLISSEKLSKTAMVQLIHLYVGKIGDTIILQYKDNQTASNLRNFEELLKIYSVLILYAADKFNDLAGYAVSGYINSFTDLDENCFKLQVQYLLQLITEDTLLKILFFNDQEEDSFWSACRLIKEGVKFQQYPTVFKKQLLKIFTTYCHEKQSMMFLENNLRNFLLLLKKIEPAKIYDEEILDILCTLSIQYDIFQNTMYNEENLLSQSTISMLPVTLAYLIQRQLEEFLTDKSTQFKLSAVNILTPMLCQTPNVVSVKNLLRIIQLQYDSVEEADAKQQIFDCVKNFATNNNTAAVGPYCPQMFTHVLLSMLRQVEMDEENLQAILDIARSLLKEPIGSVTAKVHVMFVLFEVYKSTKSTAIFDALQAQLEQFIEFWLPSIEKFDTSRRVYSVADFRFNQESSFTVFDQKLFVVPNKELDPEEQKVEIKPLPQNLVGGCSVSLKYFGDACHSFVLLIIKELYQLNKHEIDLFLLAQFKKAAQNYQRNHVHDANFLTFADMFLDLEKQNLTKVYKCACRLFEQANWLIQLRTRFFDELGEAQGFE